MYAYVVKKWKGNKTPYPLTVLLNVYCSSIGKNDFLFCLPGYMGTEKQTIVQFMRQFPRKRDAFFQNGINGSNKVKGQPYTIGHLYNIYPKRSYGHSLYIKEKDHSKVIFFLNKAPDFSEALTKEDVIVILRELRLKAILIGSSNQSFTTYYKSPADKGEADVLLVDEAAFDDGSIEASDDDEKEKIIDSKAATMNEKINEAISKDEESRTAFSIVTKSLSQGNGQNSELETIWDRYLDSLK